MAVAGDELAGACAVVRYPSQPPGLFDVDVAVEPSARRRGIGTQLGERVEAVVRAHRATRLRARVRDDQPEAVAFAERRGFVPVRRSIRSTLDLTRFDAGACGGALERVAGTGVRLSSPAERGTGEEQLRSLYAINRIASIDDPASDGTFPDFTTWRDVVAGSVHFQPAGQFVAAVGGRYVGLAAITVGTDGIAVSDIAGVEPAFRRRGIATALKVLTLQHARAAGAVRVETENDTRNLAMLSINRGLDHVPDGGYVVLERSLAG